MGDNKLPIARIILFTILLSGCSSWADDAGKSLQKAKDLEKVEIKKYQGQRLTDFNKLRDNSIQGPQAVDTIGYRLAIDGLVKKTKKYSYGQVLANDRYQKIVSLHCVEGWSAKGLFEGVLVADLLKEAEIMPGANTLIFYAVDGYSSSLTLQTVLDKKILLAYKINNQKLTAQTGFPFQLIAEDKLGYKWVKWLRRIEVSGDSTYRGFWESRGYDNRADY